MRRQLTAFLMAWGSYCAIPCPIKRWDDEARGWVLVYLPVIGLIIGALWMLVIWGMGALGFPRFLAAAVSTALPFLLSGFFRSIRLGYFFSGLLQNCLLDPFLRN